MAKRLRVSGPLIETFEGIVLREAPCDLYLRSDQGQDLTLFQKEEGTIWYTESTFVPVNVEEI